MQLFHDQVNARAEERSSDYVKRRNATEFEVKLRLSLVCLYPSLELRMGLSPQRSSGWNVEGGGSVQEQHVLRSTRDGLLRLLSGGEEAGPRSPSSSRADACIRLETAQKPRGIVLILSYLCMLTSFISLYVVRSSSEFVSLQNAD